MSSGMLKSSKTKNKLYNKKMSKPSPTNKNNFKLFNCLFNKCKKAAKKAYYCKQFEIQKNNIKQTWTLIRDVIGAQTKNRENLPNFFKQNNDILSDPSDIANGFNDFFAGIGPQLAQEIQPTTKSYRSYLKSCDSVFKFTSVSEATI